MLRRILAAYLVLATAAGPGLCCCSLPRLFARLAGTQAPVEALPPCCQAPVEDLPACGQHGAEGDAPPARGGCPGDDGHRKGGCPCRERSSAPALLDAPADPTGQAPACEWLPFSCVAAFDAAFAAPVIGASAWSLPPSTTAQDMLRHRHRLRC